MFCEKPAAAAATVPTCCCTAARCSLLLPRMPALPNSCCRRRQQTHRVLPAVGGVRLRKERVGRLVSRQRTALPLNRTVHTQNARAPTAACLVAVLCGLQHMGVRISRTDVEGTACKAALTRRTQGIGRCAAQEAGTVE